MASAPRAPTPTMPQTWASLCAAFAGLVNCATICLLEQDKHLEIVHSSLLSLIPFIQFSPSSVNFASSVSLGAARLSLIPGAVSLVSATVSLHVANGNSPPPASWLLAPPPSVHLFNTWICRRHLPVRRPFWWLPTAFGMKTQVMSRIHHSQRGWVPARPSPPYKLSIRPERSSLQLPPSPPSRSSSSGSSTSPAEQLSFAHGLRGSREQKPKYTQRMLFLSSRLLVPASDCAFSFLR